MKRKLAQGSQEMQGKIQEAMLEDFLKNSFQRDRIQTVQKWSLGVDIIQIIFSSYYTRMFNHPYNVRRLLDIAIQ